MLKAVLENLDGLDEALTQYYAQTGDVFTLQVDGVDAHPDVASLKSAYERTKADRDAARQERDEAKAKIKAIPDDFDAEKWAKLKDGKPDEAKLVQLRQEMEGTIADLKEKLTEAREANRKTAVSRDLTAALSAAGVTNPTFTNAARMMLEGQVQVNDEGAAFVETDMGPMGIEPFVQRWAAKDGKDFVTAPKGGGATGGGTEGPKPIKDMGDEERLALAREGKLKGAT